MKSYNKLDGMSRDIVQFKLKFEYFAKKIVCVVLTKSINFAEKTISYHQNQKEKAISRFHLGLICLHYQFWRHEVWLVFSFWVRFWGSVLF